MAGDQLHGDAVVAAATNGGSDPADAFPPPLRRPPPRTTAPMAGVQLHGDADDGDAVGGLFRHVDKNFLQQQLHMGFEKGLTKQKMIKKADKSIRLEDLKQNELKNLCTDNGIDSYRMTNVAMIAALKAHKDNISQQVEFEAERDLTLDQLNNMIDTLFDRLRTSRVNKKHRNEFEDKVRDAKKSIKAAVAKVMLSRGETHGLGGEHSESCEQKTTLSTDAKIQLLKDAAHLSTTVQHYAKQYATLEREFKDLKEKYSKEAKERKDLYNKLIELKGNLRVFCRCRPLDAKEIAKGASTAIDFESAKDGELIVKDHESFKVFKFDSVFSPEEDQEKVFEKTEPFATSVLDGFNVCIFAYGQTGTGKTFTMEGIEGARGVNYRTLEELFRIIKEREGMFQYEVTLSALEVYNEDIRDLLSTRSQSDATTKRLEVRQVAEGFHHVPGLVELQVNNLNEAWEVLQTGNKARAVGSTNANEHSSRSHCIHCVMVKGENLMNGECTKSRLWLIDLAGSERVKKTDAQGERLKEAQNINKSISSLGDVIHAITTKAPHIPFRNSKLTQLLQDSLSGDSKTLMFVHISPAENDVGETLNSLNFASRARGIELGQAKKQLEIGESSRYKITATVGKAKKEGKKKDALIKSMEVTIRTLEAKNKAKDLLITNLQEKLGKVTEHLSPPHFSTLVVSNEKASHRKRIKSILRRSLQKVIIRPPVVAQGGRKADAAVTQGIDSVRKADRVPQNRDKEHGWKSVTSLRNNF